jgi:hypothetical protein
VGVTFPQGLTTFGQIRERPHPVASRAHARACRAGASDINSAAVQPDRPRSRMIISVTLHGLSAGPRRGGTGTPNPRAGCFPHGLTTVETDAADSTGIPSQIITLNQQVRGNSTET